MQQFERPIDVRGKQSPYTNEEYPEGTEILGYTLPPEPDHAENDKTLQGIDSNHNNMRDDLERYAIIHSSKRPKYQKVYAAFMLQKTKGWHYFVEHHKTCENLAYLNKADHCLSAVNHKLLQDGQEDFDTSEDVLFGQIVLNTDDRYQIWYGPEQNLLAKCGYAGDWNLSNCDADFLKRGEF